MINKSKYKKDKKQKEKKWKILKGIPIFRISPFADDLMLLEEEINQLYEEVEEPNLDVFAPYVELMAIGHLNAYNFLRMEEEIRENIYC